MEWKPRLKNYFQRIKSDSRLLCSLEKGFEGGLTTYSWIRLLLFSEST
jgi:hypothetical protein